MKISLKASDPLMMIEAYRMLADKVDLRVPPRCHRGRARRGVGTIKSAIGLGARSCSEGIGDTIRVSLSADPAEEVPRRDPDPQVARPAQGRA